MNIQITSSTGTGPTDLSAFDAALNSAGVSNFNLLRLSSVIPPKSQLVVRQGGTEGNRLPGEWGDRLYVVMAEMRTRTPGQEVWAGIGWVQDESSGKGLFVEHEGHDEQSVRTDITHSLKALMKTRGVDFGPIKMVVVGCACIDQPVCALVIAAYQADHWRDYLGPLEK